MEEKEIHLRDYLKVINKRRYTVATFFIIVATITLIRTLSAVPVYTSSSRLLIEKAEPSSMMMNYYYAPYDPEFYETQYHLIKSASVAKKVVKALSLETTYGSYVKNEPPNRSLIGSIMGWFDGLYSVMLNVLGVRENVKNDDKGGQHVSDDRSRGEALDKMVIGGLAVNPVRESRMVDIAFTSTNPTLSSLIINSVANAYIETILDMRMSSSRMAIQWMTKKAQDESEKLKKSENRLQDYIRKNDIVTLENRVAIIPQKLSELGSHLLKAETKRKEMEALYKRVTGLSGSLRKAETIPAIASDPTLQSLRQQSLKAEQNIIDLSKKYGPKHPVMIRAKGEFAALKERRKEEVKRVVESIKNEFEISRENEESLSSTLSKTKGEAINLNEKFIQYGILKREQENSRQLYDALVKKIKEQNITENVQTVNVWIVEKAQTPQAPDTRNRFRNIILGIIVGLFGGAGLAFFFEYLDNTVKTPEEVEAVLGVPVLGVAPLLRSKEKVPEEIVLKEPLSPFAESYKTMRTSILLSSAESHPKSILVTSMSPGEGKTVTSVNIATAIAQSEHSVLLIDCDLRKPRIHKVFNLDNSKGLSTCLAGASDMDIVSMGPSKNLSIITSGPLPPNPSELLGSKKMQELMDCFGAKYDIILCDSPPLLTVSETLRLSSMVEGTIVVAKSGKTTYDVAKRGLKMLGDIDSHIIGLIINGMDTRKGGHYYYYNYGYADESSIPSEAET